MCGPASTVKTKPQAPATCDSSSNAFKAFRQSIDAARGATPVNRAALQRAIGSGAGAQAGAMTTDVSSFFPAHTPVAFTTTHVAAAPAAGPEARHAGRKLMA